MLIAYYKYFITILRTLVIHILTLLINITHLKIRLLLLLFGHIKIYKPIRPSTTRIPIFHNWVIDHYNTQYTYFMTLSAVYEMSERHLRAII